jgi:RNA polymerase sigma-70 factor (ECF subfamily)
MDRTQEKAFAEAFESYADELFRHASLRVQGRDRARDLTQDTFLRALEYVKKGGEIYDFRPFLYRTLRNLIIDEYRKVKTESLESLIDADEGETVDRFVPPDETNTMETAIARFDGARALSLVTELPDQYREVIVFRYLDGLSPKEIAALIGESENAVSVRLHRGLKRLRHLLEVPHKTP